MKRRKRGIIVILGLVTILLLACPFLINPFQLYLLNEVLILAIFTYSFTFLFSNAGYLSLGPAAIYGVGAYGVSLLLKHVTGSLYLSFLGAILMSGLASLIIGIFCVRLGRWYFGMLTLAFAQMIYTIIFRWRSLTGGDDGLTNIPRPPLEFLFRVSLDSQIGYYYFTLVLFLITVVIMWRLFNSNFGYSLRCIRDNVDRAAFIGINVRTYALIAFVISGLFSGLAGALRAPLSRMASADLAYWTTSLEPTLASLIGGIYTFTGPLIGSFIYIFLKAYAISFFQNWTLLMGFILLIIVLFFRNGIMGFLAYKFGWRV
jgi:branched-chain amino acid transport system permease protein